MHRRLNLMIWLPLLATIIGLFGSAYLLINAYYPSNRYTCLVKNIPPGTKYLSIVVETRGRIENVNYYLPPKILPPSTIPSPHCIWSYRDEKSPPSVQHRIEFRRGEKYGVIVRNADGRWEIIWSGSTIFDERSWGGKTLELDLKDGTVQVPQQEDLVRLGMKEVENLFKNH
jgi:hypothetical protein